MKTILLVDDSETCRMLFKLSIPNERDYAIHEARNVDMALQKLDDIEPDMVVMDYSMPGKNGLQLAQMMRAQGIKAPLTLLTASVEDEVFRSAIAVHFDLVFEKPINEDKMAEILKKISHQGPDLFGVSV